MKFIIFLCFAFIDLQRYFAVPKNKNLNIEGLAEIKIVLNNSCYAILYWDLISFRSFSISPVG